MKSVSKKKVRSGKKRVIKRKSQPTSTVAPKPGVYRVGTLYGTLFSQGTKGFTTRAELIKHVALLTKKSEKVVGFAYQVLRSRNHKSNNGRSTVVEENGKVKLIPIRK